MTEYRGLDEDQTFFFFIIMLYYQNTRPLAGSVLWFYVVIDI